MKRWTLVAVSAVLLAGCEIMPPVGTPTERIEVIDIEPEPTPPPVVEETPPPTPERVPRQVAFSEAEYAALEKHGNAAITGRLTVNGQPQANRPVSAAPVTRYSAEAAEQALAGVAVEPADPRAREYTHSTRTDGNGYFLLNGLPAGEFFLSGVGTDPASGEARVVIRQIILRSGQQLEADLAH